MTEDVKFIELQPNEYHLAKALQIKFQIPHELRENGSGNFMYFYTDDDENTYVQAEGATTGDFAGDVMFKIKGRFTDLDLYKLMTYSFDAEIHYLENKELIREL